MKAITLNEAIHVHSAIRANESLTKERFNYWNTIHEGRCEALRAESLVFSSKRQAFDNDDSLLPAMLREQAM